MTQIVRLRELVAILEARHLPVHRDDLLAELGVSLATFKRDVTLLRDQMHAPIEHQRPDGASRGGYVLADKSWSAGKLGLPRAWFSASEIRALLMIDELARHLGPGPASEHVQALVARITSALSLSKDDPAAIRGRIRIVSSANRRKATPHFETIAQATVRRERLRIRYFTRSRNARSERDLSPQRLVHYKENWYLVAHCHSTNALRIFALDAIENAAIIADESVHDAHDEAVDALIGPDFGIFSGDRQGWAMLRFTAAQAAWVRSETWHAEQRMTEHPDGSIVLEVPYSDPRELLLEICRFGPDVEVLEPGELRNATAARLERAAAQYRR